MSRGSRLETVASEGRLHEDGARQAQRTSVSEHPSTVGRCHAQAQYLCKASLVATARRENVTIAARPTRADDTGCFHLLDHARRPVVADLQAALPPRYRGDRKSVVWGKSVSVRVDPGGRRLINKKKKTKT